MEEVPDTLRDRVEREMERSGMSWREAWRVVESEIPPDEFEALAKARPRSKESTTATVSAILGFISLGWWLAVFVASIVVFITGLSDLASEPIWMAVFAAALVALPVLAIAVGVIALFQIRSNPDVGGRGLAWAGIALGAVGLIPSVWMAVAIAPDSGPGVVTVTGTVVYTDPATFQADSNDFLARCTPREGELRADPALMRITGGAISTATLYEGEVGAGTMSAGRCLVYISVAVEHRAFMTVHVGPICGGSNSAIIDGPTGDRASFDTIEVTNC